MFYNKQVIVDPQVLLVEDDADTESLIIRALRKIKVLEVAVARDGQEAIEMIAGLSKAPNLVLLDLKLPKVDGFEVLLQLQQRGFAEQCPIVVFSSEDSATSFNRARSLGAAEYAVKPTNFEELQHTIERLAARYLQTSLTNSPTKS